MNSDRKTIGNLGELIASRYLVSKNYNILEQNYRKKYGEIDIIAEKDSIVAFVEVKTNSKHFQGNFEPELRVDHKKTKKIYRVAQSFILNRYGNLEKPWQIDIVSITLDSRDKSAKLKHFKNIFS